MSANRLLITGVGTWQVINKRQPLRCGIEIDYKLRALFIVAVSEAAPAQAACPPQGRILPPVALMTKQAHQGPVTCSRERTVREPGIQVPCPLSLPRSLSAQYQAHRPSACFSMSFLSPWGQTFGPSLLPFLHPLMRADIAEF